VKAGGRNHSLPTMNVDPRLQTFSYDSSDFGFPSHPVGGAFDPNLDPYLPLDQHQQQNALPQSSTASARRAAAATSHVQQQSPQMQIRNAQAAALNQRMNSPSSIGLRRQNTNTTSTANNFNSHQPRTPTNLVWKNSTTAYPHGATISDDPSVMSFSNLNPQPPNNLHNNTSEDYFSSQPAQPFPVLDDDDLDDPPVDLPPGQESANPFSSTYPLVTDPPNLELWRMRLFDIPNPIHLTEGQFLTYFPHIDNVYSHRSTQKYKRKPFVSHYWDCRLKGRPSGTKKSNDPNIKRRKREKRERDLCDVKVKITEWFSKEEAEAIGLTAVALGEGEAAFDYNHGFGMDGLQVVMDERSGVDEGIVNTTTGKTWPRGHPGADGKKWYTIQRVNGSANSGGKKPDELDDDLDEMGDPKNLDHKHSLEDSDRIKKNSVQRYLLKEEKERRASKKPRIDSSHILATPNTFGAQQATTRNIPSAYLASGPASSTIKLHRQPSKSHLTFFANAFCPFAQRVWIALEIKGISYQFVEITPEMLADVNQGNRDLANDARNTSPNGTPIPSGSIAKQFKSSRAPKELLDVNPDANIPCIKHGNWGIWESNVMMEYLEDLSNSCDNMGTPLLPVNQPQLRAHCRLWVDHVNRKVLPAFYALLLTPPPRRRSAPSTTSPNNVEDENDPLFSRHRILLMTLQDSITSLVNASHAVGPFFLGDSITYVDVAFAPWIIRLSRVMEFYRKFPKPEVGTRWMRWVEAVEGDERVMRTVSDERSYHGVYRGVGEDGYGVLSQNSPTNADLLSNSNPNLNTNTNLDARGTLASTPLPTHSTVPGASPAIPANTISLPGGGTATGTMQNANRQKKVMVEMKYARKIMGEEGFGLGGDLYGLLGVDADGSVGRWGGGRG
jgi:glutathione S-transferase